MSSSFTGAGTDICRKCAGPKEESRRGSDRCRACNKPSTKPLPKGKRRVEVDLTPHLWAALHEEARARSVTIGVLVERILLVHVS